MLLNFIRHLFNGFNFNPFIAKRAIIYLTTGAGKTIGTMPVVLLLKNNLLALGTY
jgi:superfamily II DNA or RNA helicase